MAIPSLGPFPIGAAPPITVTFTKADGTLADPTGTVSFKFTSPAGVKTTYTVGVDSIATHVSTGVYQCTPTLNEATTSSATWQGRAQGTVTGLVSTPIVDFTIQVNASPNYP